MQQLICKKYKIFKQIGSGSFGKVYCAENIKNNTYVAIKVEKVYESINNVHNITPLAKEYKIYSKLLLEYENSINKVSPIIYDFYRDKKEIVKKNDKKYYRYKQYLVMELLGSSLLDVHYNYNGHIPSINIYSFGYQMIALIEALHNIGWLHRDVKPDNFLVGNNNYQVYLIDFGLSCKWEDLTDKYNPVINGQSSSSIVGTARYMSINVHAGKTYSWRDDLESLGYVLIFFAKGHLPWKGFKEKNGKKLMKKIYKSKVKNKRTLCDGISEIFYKYMKYCWNLEVDETPDYSYLKSLFKKKLKKKLKSHTHK
jgi:serine/threonine protein kinase